jgi:serine protease Do
VTSVTVGEASPIKVIRNGKEMDLTITVAQRPGSQAVVEKKKGDEKKGKKQKDHIDTGMTMEDITPVIAKDLGMPEKTRGVVVDGIQPDGPADRAGLGRGDVILEVDRKPVKDVDGFYSMVKEKKSYLLRVRRSDPQNHEAFAVVILDLKD